MVKKYSKKKSKNNSNKKSKRNSNKKSKRNSKRNSKRKIGGNSTHDKVSLRDAVTILRTYYQQNL
jgi:hypothetical protein